MSNGILLQVLRCTNIPFNFFCSVPNKGRYLGRGKRPYVGSVLFPSSTCHGAASGEDGTPPLSLVRRSLGEGGKPFPGIYLFRLQIDKCHSSFKKVPIQKLIIKIFTDLPVLGTEPFSIILPYLFAISPFR